MWKNLWNSGVACTRLNIVGRRHWPFPNSPAETKTTREGGARTLLGSDALYKQSARQIDNCWGTLISTTDFSDPPTQKRCPAAVDKDAVDPSVLNFPWHPGSSDILPGGRYDNPVPSWFLAPVDCLKVHKHEIFFWLFLQKPKPYGPKGL
jgi:hypothetical protein